MSTKRAYFLSMQILITNAHKYGYTSIHVLLWVKLGKVFHVRFKRSLGYINHIFVDIILKHYSLSIVT